MSMSNTTKEDLLPTDANGHVWELRKGVMCVECPHCLFTFDAVHTVEGGGYSCPNCNDEGCDTNLLPDEKPLPLYLECAMCGASKSFVIDPRNPSIGYCFAEKKAWTISRGGALNEAGETWDDDYGLDTTKGAHDGI